MALMTGGAPLNNSQYDQLRALTTHYAPPSERLLQMLSLLPLKHFVGRRKRHRKRCARQPRAACPLHISHLLSTAQFDFAFALMTFADRVPQACAVPSKAVRARQRENIHGEDLGALATRAGPGRYFLHHHDRDGQLGQRRGRAGHHRRGRSRSTSAELQAAAKVSSKSTAVSGKSVGTAHRAEAPLLSLPGRPRSERVALVALPLARAADACFRPSSAGHRARCPSV